MKDGTYTAPERPTSRKLEHGVAPKGVTRGGTRVPNAHDGSLDCQFCQETWLHGRLIARKCAPQGNMRCLGKGSIFAVRSMGMLLIHIKQAFCGVIAFRYG